MERRRPATIAMENGHRLKCVRLPLPSEGARFLAACTCNWQGKRPRHTMREVRSDAAIHILAVVKALKAL